MRLIVLACLLAVAAVLVAAGAWVLHPAAGLAAAGVLLAGWAWLVLADDAGEG